MLLYKEGMSGIHSIDFSGNINARYQIILLKGLDGLKILQGQWNPGIFTVLNRLALIHLIPKQPRVGTLVLFRLPSPADSVIGKAELPGHRNLIITDPAARLRSYLNDKASGGEITVKNGRLLSADSKADGILSALENTGNLSVACTGDKGGILFVPVSGKFMFLSNYYKSENIVFNSHFFLMDITDLETDYDVMGEPYGLLMLNGKIIIPPVYRRSALFFGKDGRSSIIPVGIEDIDIIIDGTIYRDGRNCRIFKRPEYDRVPSIGGTSFVIVGRRIAAYSANGNADVPEAGFVLHANRAITPGSLNVDYSFPGREEFGIQVGPPLVRNGKMLEDLIDPFFNGDGIKFPPTVYPPGWESGRAARLGLGIKDGVPCLIWGEGSKSNLYKKGIDSPGFTLKEFAEIASEHGMTNFINLDGGGSAQVSVGGKRMLRIADRDPDTGTEFERPVPAGLGLGL